MHRVHRLAGDVDLRKTAQATPGFSGADLANVVNEAALLAVRRGRDAVMQEDFDEAVEKVVAGPERKSRRLGEEEKRRVAYHEAGHALVSTACRFADPVRKISIVPGDGTARLDCSDETAREIDHEVKALLDAAYEEAKTVLARRRGTLERIAAALLERETLEGDEFQRLLEGTGA